MKKLHTYALRVNNNSRAASTSTEDAMMPMISLAILFPNLINNVLYAIDTYNDAFNVTSSVLPVNINNASKTKSASRIILDTNLFFLIINVASSMLSIGYALTSSYFSRKSKTEEDRNWKNRCVFNLSMICQICARLSSYQLFIYGIFIKCQLKLPDVIFAMALVLPHFITLFRGMFMLFIDTFYRKSFTNAKTILYKSYSPFQYVSFDHSARKNKINILPCAYEIITLIETIILALLGSYFLFEMAENEHTWIYVGTGVVLLHYLAIMIKAYYYSYMHRWMDRSKDAYNIIFRTFWIMVISLIIGVMIALYHFEILPLGTLIVLIVIPVVSSTK